MTDWLKIFQEAAEEIEKKIKPFLGSEKAKTTAGMGAGGDKTKYIDLLAEGTVIKILEAHNISCTLISEECGVKKIGNSREDYVVLDSIDGTTNATRSIPFFSTSLAHAKSGFLKDIDVALVRDLNNDHNFTAKKQEGAFQDNKPLRSSQIDRLEEAIIALDLSRQDRFQILINQIIPILWKSLKIRSMGSTALEICYVASGALDAFLDLRGTTRAIDIAAAYLILQESGGITLNLKGEKVNIPLKADSRSTLISTGNRDLSKDILETIRDH